MHKTKRKTEMKNYIFGKIDKWATEESYYEILSDEERMQELVFILGLEEKDLKELRNQIMGIRSDRGDIDGKEFVYGELQTLVGVYKAKSGKAGEPSSKAGAASSG